MPFKEKPKRSLIKAVTYRFISILTDGLVVFLITHRYDTTVKVIVVTNLISALLYFGHERFWNSISWGKLHHKKKL